MKRPSATVMRGSAVEISALPRLKKRYRPFVVDVDEGSDFLKVSGTKRFQVSATIN